MRKSLYTWLYRNQKEWLQQNAPSRKVSKPIKSRVDWASRDKEILKKVKVAVHEIWEEEGKPKRISISRVGSKTGLRALLEKHLAKLPKTRAYFQYVMDNDHDYRMRRINWAIRELEIAGEDLQVWKILRKAAIREEYADGLEEKIIRLINL